MTTTDAPTTGSRRGRVSTTTPDRIPVPTRQRRPGLAALALVLILGGAALSGYLVLHSSHKRTVVFATHEIKVGQQIQPGDLTDGEISATLKRGVDFRPVLYGDVGSLTGQYATTTIPSGAIVSKDMYGTTQPTQNCSEVALSVAQGSYPPGGIAPGDLVEIVAVPKANSSSDAGAAASSKATVVAPAAYVTGVHNGATGQGGGVVISVLAPRASDPNGGGTGSDLALATANAQGDVQVIGLPKATDPSAFVQGCRAQ